VNGIDIEYLGTITGNEIRELSFTLGALPARLRRVVNFYSTDQKKGDNYDKYSNMSCLRCDL
jgi:hypothetical protein